MYSMPFAAIWCNKTMIGKSHLTYDKIPQIGRGQRPGAEIFLILGPPLYFGSGETRHF